MYKKDPTLYPRVSVLICTFNAERFIKNTLSSVLDQTYKNIEILILDNASSDTTVQIVKNIQNHNKGILIKLFEGKENLGAYGGVNFLLEKAKGDFIAIQDHDDIWHPEKVLKQVAFLGKHPEYVGCGTGHFEFFEKNKTLRRIYYNWGEKIVHHPTLMFRANTSYKYDINLPIYADRNFMTKVLCSNEQKLHTILEVLHISVIRGDNNNLHRKWLTWKSVYIYYKYTGDFTSTLDSFKKLIIPYGLRNFLNKKFFSRKEMLKVNDLVKNTNENVFLKYLS